MARSKRSERRARERDVAKLVRDRERLALLEPGGSAERPIDVSGAAVVEVRATTDPCPQCQGPLRVIEHRAVGVGQRAVDVRCERCGVARTRWFRLVGGSRN